MRTPFRVLVPALLAAAVLAPSAQADGGPSLGISLSPDGVADPASGLIYATQAEGSVTALVVSNRDWQVLRTRKFDRVYGIPLVASDGTTGGLSRDGRTLFLAEGPLGGAGLAVASRLLVLDTTTFRTRLTIDLRGDFSFDALSPDARTLYLIQHTSANDYERYRVRAYDLSHHKLRPHAIVDRTEPNMRGYPVSRLEAPGGAWVYTLYMHPEGGPFVHALDTVHGHAECLDLPWQGPQQRLYQARLELQDNGRRLAVVDPHGKVAANLSLKTANAAGVSPTTWTAAGVSGLALLCTGFLLWRRRIGLRATR